MKRSSQLLIIGLATLAIAILMVAVTGESPVATYIALFYESLGDGKRIAITIGRILPILGIGSAAWLSLRAGIFNIGQEGQLVLGGITAAVLGTAISLPGVIAIPTTLAISALAGALLAMFAGFLEIRYRVPILISTLLLNFLAVGAVSYLVNFTFQEAGSLGGQTAPINESVRIPRLVAGTTLSYGLFIILAIALATAILVNRTKFGYQFRMMGANRDFARASNIDIKRTTYLVLGLSGSISALTGAVLILGIHYRYADGVLTAAGVAWTGILVAILAGRRAWVLLLGSAFFGILASGAGGIERATNVPYEFIAVLQATVILMMTIQVGLANKTKPVG